MQRNLSFVFLESHRQRATNYPAAGLVRETRIGPQTRRGESTNPCKNMDFLAVPAKSSPYAKMVRPGSHARRHATSCDRRGRRCANEERQSNHSGELDRCEECEIMRSRGTNRHTTRAAKEKGTSLWFGFSWTSLLSHAGPLRSPCVSVRHASAASGAVSIAHTRTGRTVPQQLREIYVQRFT